MTRTTAICERSSTSPLSVSGSRVFACASRDTVTFVSEVETRSMESPQARIRSNASARKPTSCHIPSVSSVTSTTFVLTEIALSPGWESPPADETTVPSDSGSSVLRMRIGIPESRTAGMHRGVQDLASCGGDLLCLVVCKSAQDAGRGHEAGIGCEHAGHVGPDLEALCRHGNRKIGSRSVRPAPAEQDRLAFRTAGDEPLG